MHNVHLDRMRQVPGGAWRWSLSTLSRLDEAYHCERIVSKIDLLTILGSDRAPTAPRGHAGVRRLALRVSG
jgi:hypothetical protein